MIDGLSSVKRFGVAQPSDTVIGLLLVEVSDGHARPVKEVLPEVGSARHRGRKQRRINERRRRRRARRERAIASIPTRARGVCGDAARGKRAGQSGRMARIGKEREEEEEAQLGKVDSSPTSSQLPGRSVVASRPGTSRERRRGLHSDAGRRRRTGASADRLRPPRPSTIALSHDLCPAARVLLRGYLPRRSPLYVAIRQVRRRIKRNSPLHS